ncbi:MAG: prolipoprotein diacylglyceryl transferase family protein [Desulfatitalea sp.]
MIGFLGWGAQYPILKTIGEIIYYGTIAGVIIVFLILAGKRLLALGYPKKRVIIFTVLSIGTSFPVGYYGSRGAGMFYRPVAEWSVSVFFDTMLHGSSHTFHASLIGPLLFGMLLCYLLRLKFFEVFDTIYLYVPLAHALGRISCLIIGCCWGNLIDINLYGWHLKFQNPVPLYELMTNLVIFLFLRRIYRHVYADAGLRQRYAGSVFASYFVLYAPLRIVYEVFRREHRIFSELTQAQVVMMIFMAFSAICFLAIRRRYLRHRAQADLLPVIGAQDAETLKRLFSLGGLVVSFLLADFLIFYLTHQVHLWKWPIQPVVSLADTYGRIFYYLPVMLIPAYSLYWLKNLGEPIRPWFQWQRWSYVFPIALAMSIYYSVELLVLRKLQLRGLEFWPPIIVMSVMNAFAEEIMFRLALVRFLRRVEYAPWVANLVQSLVYSVIHFMAVGTVLGLFSLVYGFVLGLVAQRTNSILPAIICHFIIDIGCIGMPILRL